jgi:hypothetical protein
MMSRAAAKSFRNKEKFPCYARLIGEGEKALAKVALAKGLELDSGRGMIRPGFLSRKERTDLVALARDGSVTHRLARRANALALLELRASRQGAVVARRHDPTVAWRILRGRSKAALMQPAAALAL